MYDYILIANVILWVAVCGIYVRQGRASMFHPFTFYLIFHFIVFVVRPLLANWYRYFDLYYAYRFVPTMDVKITTILAADVGMLAFMLGTFVTARSTATFKSSSMVLERQPQIRNLFLVASVLLAPIGIYSLAQSIQERATGITTMISAGDGLAINTTGNGYFTEAQAMLITVAVLIPWMFRFRLWSLGIFVLFVIGRGATGGRWPIVVGGIALALAYLYEHRAKWLGPKTVLGVLALFMVFNFVGADRGARIRALWNSDQVVVTNPNEQRFLEGMDWGNMEFFEYLVNTVPERTGTYNYFLDLLQVFTEPVPRVLWPDKPLGPPVQLYNLWDYGTPIGITYSLPGEGWVNLGWLGVLIWCGLAGLFYGQVYEWFMRSRQTPYQIALYLLFLPISIQVYRDGTLLTLLKFSFITLAPVLLWRLLLIYHFASNGHGWPRLPRIDMQRTVRDGSARR